MITRGGCLESRISAAISAARDRGRCALATYAVAGHPSYAGTSDVVAGMARGGADIIELGYPFSDPMADGRDIQGASASAIAGGATRKRFLRLVRSIRSRFDVPLVLMTYSNIPYSAGFGGFIKEAADAGIDGMILPDMPVDESAEYRRAARGRLDTIFLASPNTAPARMRQIAAASTGFMYLVAVYGTTGSAGGPGEGAAALGRARRASQVPVGVGFGISSAADARAYARAGADLVIVGSAYARLIAATPRRRLGSATEALTRRLAAGCQKIQKKAA